MNATTLISKIWNFCHTLRDDGVGYGDYLEQLTFLLFLKMAHEQKTLNPFESVDVGIPAGYDWESLICLKGAELETHYLKVLNKLGTMSGMLGAIFFKAQNKIHEKSKSEFRNKYGKGLYDKRRGELSATTIINRVMPIISGWLAKEKQEVKTEFVRSIFTYVTSRSPKSGKFVIAK